KESPQRKRRRQNEAEKEQRENKNDRAGSIQVGREKRRQAIADNATSTKRLTRNLRRAERERHERRYTAEEQAGTDQLRVCRIERAAPEVVPSEHHQHDRHEIRRIAKHLI